MNGRGPPKVPGAILKSVAFESAAIRRPPRFERNMADHTACVRVLRARFDEIQQRRVHIAA